MKVGLVLVFAAVALLSSSTAWKSKKKSLSIDMTDSKYKPWIPKIKKQSLSKFDDNKVHSYLLCFTFFSWIC